MTSLLPWAALLLPLASAIVILVATRPLRTASAFVSVGAVLGSFVCACLIFFQQTAAAPRVSWINLAPVFSVPLGLTLDPLSRSMLFMVTGVGSVIHIYSLGYMSADEGKSRYSVAQQMKISFAAATHRFNNWRKMGGSKRQRTLLG